VEVPDTSGALLIVDGQFRKVLEPGLHVFWKFQRSVKVDMIDRRVQALEVSVGIKDIILPGDMKEILNKVVEAEKVAQANLIKRREETAATRSLLNTARLMDENPTLMRLKELETLEKVTEKVDKLTVFGGLEGVLEDVVRIHARKARPQGRAFFLDLSRQPGTVLNTQCLSINADIFTRTGGCVELR
jgi:regulator of protease activity HflC (stomatin/prohibitin superfamily)